MSSIAGSHVLADARLMRLLTVLNAPGEEARLAGGAVRNALLGEPVADVDLATTALPQETMRRAAAAGFKVVPTGLAHGTVTVVVDGVAFEVTSLREDVETDGRHAVVRFGRDWQRDAERRDFTMNALYATADGRVIDLVGGLADLAARRVRFIGDATQRIREDYLRILRLFRFHARYGAGPLDGQALSAAIRGRQGLRRLSRERVGAEMMKLLPSPGAPPTVAIMSDSGILSLVLGGVARHAAFARLAALEAHCGVRPDALVRLGVLALWVPEDASRLHDRLRLSRNDLARLSAMVGRRGPALADKAALRQLIFAAGPQGASDRLLWMASAQGADAEALGAALSEVRQWAPPRFPLRAADFRARGLHPGPQLGAALACAKAAWIAADFPQDPAAIARCLELGLTQAGSDKPD